MAKGNGKVQKACTSNPARCMMGGKPVDVSDDVVVCITCGGELIDYNKMVSEALLGSMSDPKWKDLFGG